MKRKLTRAATLLTSPDLHAGRKAVRKSAMKAGKWAMRRMGRDPGPDYTSIALRGLGAVAITLPIGYLIGRRLMSHSSATE